MKKPILAAMIAATTLTAAPVFGDPPPWAPAHGRRHHDRDYRQTLGGIRYWSAMSWPRAGLAAANT